MFTGSAQNIRDKLQKNIDIDEFTKVIQKLVYSNLQENQIEQVINSL
ncbi:19144_t:CDS:2 [Cetraspora pellucida]|uniref:19144_t:CDS:1 n=1 Tax=Cetraspora pellucida TaxID=1433469 RepID=A0A9N9D2I5_9GLOM|nr:19144_t:CDS:2 [Cetraspora pellucida]